MRLTPEGWKTWLPPKDHPTYRAFRALHDEELADLYSQQQDVFRRLMFEYGVVAAGCIPVFEGVLAGIHTVWSSGHETLLPKTDWVAFAILDPALVEKVRYVPPVTWDDVQAIVGHRMELTEYSPPRYRTTSFPSEEEIVLLRDAAERGGFPMPGTNEVH